MTVPFGISSRFSLMTLISKFTTRTIMIQRVPEEFVGLSMTNYIMAADDYFPIIYKVNILAEVFNIAAIVWLIVATALIIAFGFIYFITNSDLKSATLLRENIYISEKVTSPAVYGVFRHRIILPVSYNKNDLPYILMHERKHIRRADNLRRVIAFVITSIHWFNPFAWIFLREYLTETELACDEAVLSGYDENERKRYALSLVNAAENREIFASAFGGAEIRVRISRILSYKKLSVFSLCAFAVLAVTVIYVLITNAV
jgi:beta-lactamase regulating signal transducer with metallopeptidase domain